MEYVAAEKYNLVSNGYIIGTINKERDYYVAHSMLTNSPLFAGFYRTIEEAKPALIEECKAMIREFEEENE